MFFFITVVMSPTIQGNIYFLLTKLLCLLLLLLFFISLFNGKIQQEFIVAKLRIIEQKMIGSDYKMTETSLDVIFNISVMSSTIKWRYFVLLAKL